MKQIIAYILVLTTAFSFAQGKEDKQLALATQKSNNLVYEANDLASSDDFISAEMEYRKALSEKPTSVAGTYNLAHSYYKEGNYEEALYRNKQAAKNATDKSEKHRAFHNIGNILMKNNKCKEAEEAFKNALRNNPTDDESRYNLSLAKECAKKQEEQQEQDDKNDKDKDKKEDENKDQKDKEDEGKDKEDEKDKGDKDKKEGEDKKDEEGKPKDEKEDKGEGKDKKEQQKPQPQPGKMSPQQIKNLLEAMNNQEQKVQDKMNANKAKGIKIQTEKDW